MTTLPPLIIAAAACLTTAIPLVVWSLSTRAGAERRQTLTNLGRDGAAGPAAAVPPMAGAGLTAVAHRATPAPTLQTLDRLLSRAGRPGAWPLERVVVTKFLAAAVTAALLLLLVGRNPSVPAVIFGAATVAFVWFLPELLLYNVGQKRRQKIQEALPDALDQLTIAVEAGLGFESALAQVAKNGRGPLGEEIVRTLQDIQVGQPRRHAYTDLARRTHVTDLRRFIRSIIQAEEHGISIARVLATQAKEMRVRRRQRAEEKAMQIPVKVVFPLILLILPVLFIVVLGPAAVNMLEAFPGAL